MAQLNLHVGNHSLGEGGHALTEYALIIALISVALLAALIALTGDVERLFQQIIGGL